MISSRLLISKIHARPVRAISILLGIAFLAGIIWSAPRAFRAIRIARELNASVQSLRQHATALQDAEDISIAIETVRDDLNHTRTLLTELRNTIEPFEGVLAWIEWMPVYGDDLAAIPPTLDTVEALLNSASYLDTALSPLLELLDTEGADQETLVTVLRTVEDAQPLLSDARDELEVARRARETITELDGLVPELGERIRDIDQAIELLDLGLASLESLPLLLGADEPHHILVLLQNADEIRSTGGFITSSAYIVIDRGEIVELSVFNSLGPPIDRSDFDYERPPFPLHDYFGQRTWHFRDANWSPDFPTSARKAADLYTLGREVPVDTVVGINQYTLQAYMGAVGEIQLPDGTVVNADNIIGLLHEQWSESFQQGGFDARKDFIPELAPLLFESLLDVNSVPEMLSYANATQDSIRRGDLLVYSDHASIQSLAQRLGADGSIPIQPGDYIYVVDTNLGFNKTDLWMRRHMTYQINLTDLTAPRSTLRLEYVNPSPGQYRGVVCLIGTEPPTNYADRADDCYRDFLRLYIPNNSTMLLAPQFDESSIPAYSMYSRDPLAGRVRYLVDEREKAVFGGLMVVPPNSSIEATFIYDLSPAQIMSLRPDGLLVYDLLVQKQPGVQEYPVTIIIELPLGVSVRRTSPQPTYMDKQTAIFEQTLDAHINVQLVLALPASLQRMIAEDVPPQEVAQVGTTAPRVVPEGYSPTIPPTTVPSPTLDPGGPPDLAEPNYDFSHAYRINPSDRLTGLNFNSGHPGAIDNDFFVMAVRARVTYTCRTEDLAQDVDTNMILYHSADFSDLIGGNDDEDAQLGLVNSQVTFTARSDTDVFILVGYKPEYVRFIGRGTYTLLCFAGGS